MARFLLPAGLAAAVLLSACAEEAVTAETPPRAARIETVSAAGDAARREFVGRVEARLTVDLAFQVGGRLADFSVAEGEVIPEGTVVARLQDQDFARALREAQVQLQQARQNLERVQTLHERGIAADAALEDARTAFDLRSVAVENARQNLAYATLSAPFDALISRRFVDPFTTVSPGQPVLRLQDISELRVAISVPESLIATLDREDAPEVTARFPFLPGQVFPLEYRELNAEADSASRTYQVVFALPVEVPANILPGMTASVDVLLNDPAAAQSAAAVRAPLSALASGADGGFYVYVFDEASGEVRRRAVSTGRVAGEEVLIDEGLSAGERIVTAGVHALHDGMRVRPIDAVVRYGSAAPER